MQALGKLLIESLLIPLIEKGLRALIQFFQTKKKIKDKLENAQVKVKEYKDAKTKKDSIDKFSKLP